MVPSEIRRISEKIISTKSPNWLRFLVGADARDAIENAGLGNVPQGREYRLRDPRAHVLRRLGHVTVNPQDMLNTNMLKRSYVYFGGERTLTTRGEIIVNSNPAMTKEFLERLVDLAFDARILSEEYVPDATGEIMSTERCMLLFGEKGCGKTFFLNHILSTYHEYLDEQKCVWVRLNLVDDRSFDDDMYSWVFAQIAKIVFRYYDASSVRYKSRPGTVSDFSKHLSEWIQEQDVTPPLKLRWEEALVQMKQVFCRDHDRGISAEFCVTTLCEEVYNYAKKCGLSFIIVLDGFDRLEGNEDEPDRFEKIKRGVIKLLSEYEKLGCIFVVTTRVLTFASVQTVNPFSTINANNRYFVEASPIDKIFGARIEAIIKEIEDLRSTLPQWAQENWAQRIREFEVEILSSAADTESLSSIEAALSHNNRAKTQIIRLRFQDFLQRKTFQGYQLLEHMTRGGMRYPPLIFSYARNGSSTAGTISTPTTFDNYFLPIISRPPLLQAPHIGNDDDWLQMGSILHGIRMLQIVDAHDSLIKSSEGARIDRITIGELSDVLYALFKYSKEQTVIFCRELEQYEVFRFTERAPANRRSNITMLTGYPKLRFLLTRCLGDLAYINLCAMRCRVAKDALDTPELFRPAFIDYDEARSLPRWVIRKIVNSVSLLAAMTFINDRQRRQFAVDQGPRMLHGRMKTTIERAIKLGMFRLVEELTPRVLSEIETVARSTGKVPGLSADAILTHLEGVADKLNV